MRKISFNLEKWLQDKSRKIRTGDGRPVRIICIDRKGKSGNIVGLVGEDESLIYVWNNNGIHIVSCMEENNLFFAEEDKTIDDTEMNSLAYLTELGYTCIPHKEEQNARSEEDECMIECIIAAIKMGDYYTQDELNRMTSWLKLLKPNHWKPTEEQMEALNWIAYNYALMDKGTEEKLQSLYNDLKSL